MNREEMRDRLRDRILEFHGRDGSNDSDMALATGLADALVDVVDDEALDRMANTLLEETNLRAMDFRNGMSMEIKPARALAANFVGAARAMLGEAPNYSETPVEMTTSLAADPEVPATWEKFAFIVQRIAPGKLTPHEARMAAEQRADAAEAKQQAVADLIARARRRPGNAFVPIELLEIAAADQPTEAVTGLHAAIRALLTACLTGHPLPLVELARAYESATGWTAEERT